MITRIPIEKTEIGVCRQSFQHLVDEGRWEMILFRCRVKFSVINTHSPSRDGTLRDKLVLSVFNYRHSSFFRNHLDGTNPVAMWYGINNPDVKKFEDFLFHDFPHHIIEPTLWFTCGRACRVNRYMMGTECWANPLEVLQGIPEDRPMLF